MKKTFILFSFVLCTLLLGSCNKEQDRTSSGTESSSNPNGPAEDPYAEEFIPNASQDSTSAVPDASQPTDVPNKATRSTTAASGNASENNKKEDSVTSVAGQQGAGSGVGNGGSINAAKEAQKK